MSKMNDYLRFSDRAAFRAWLDVNSTSSEGVWLLFGKKGGPRTISASEALEEALCFGWIDGQMQRIDDTTYCKYFAERRAKSNWSEKNKTLAAKLEQEGKMTALGRSKIAQAKENGQWAVAKPSGPTEEDIAALSELLKGHEPASANFEAMSLSVKKTYTRAYLDAKTDAGKKKRWAWMIERLNKNLKPM